MTSSPDSKARFSDRVADYVKYRPGYPPETLRFVHELRGSRGPWRIADIGSGTGLLSQLFLDDGHAVTGIEPNREMREAAERLLAQCAGFTSVDGTAENTTLEAASVDLVTAGQAFHWFDPAVALPEFVRIAGPEGHVVLVWNDRLKDATPFLREYESLLQAHATDYAKVDHSRFDDAALRGLLGPGATSAHFPNRQDFDFAGLRGRLLSSSYVPPSSDPRSAPMLDALRALFDEHAQDGRVSLLYRTEVTACSTRDLARHLAG